MTVIRTLSQFVMPPISRIWTCGRNRAGRCGLDRMLSTRVLQPDAKSPPNYCKYQPDHNSQDVRSTTTLRTRGRNQCLGLRRPGSEFSNLLLGSCERLHVAVHQNGSHWSILLMASPFNTVELRAKVDLRGSSPVLAMSGKMRK